jgi:glycosyltransferase involved in cell wall biosynthesis
MHGNQKSIDAIVHLSTGKSLRGGERQAIWLHQGLLERGYQSRLLCRAHGDLSRQPTPRITPIAWRGEWDVAGLLRIITLCKGIAPNLIHCHDAHALLHGSIAGALLNIPVVYSRRVIFPLKKGFLSRWKYRQCRMLLAVSGAVARQCEEVASPENIRIVPDGVDWNALLLPRMAARSALGIPMDGFVIGTVGHFTSEKNLPLVVALARALRKTNPEVTIVCIGPTQTLPEEAADNLKLIGFRDAAVTYYSAFDLYISASLHEGLGSALLDAVVRDIPAVAVDAGGTKDIFPEHWPLVVPGDREGFIAAVVKVIDDYQAALSGAKECGIRARNLFSIASTVEKTIEAYDFIISNRRGGV